ncbi:MAG: hypothetical protein V3S71_09060 [Acidobacteriota bacterium]
MDRDEEYHGRSGTDGLGLGERRRVMASETVEIASGRRLGRAGYGLVVCLLVLLGVCDEVSGASSQAYFERAEAFRLEGNFRASTIELKNALQQDPQNASARLSLGMNYVELGDALAAEKELRRAHELGTDWAKGAG